MDNKAIAGILYETADLLEIDGQDSFRIRSYRNAAQAIENDGTVRIQTVSDGKTVTVSVTDSGQGISPENLKRIFDPFFTTKPVGEGTGLGLSISHGIVEQHGGTIAVNNIPGEGTTFTIILPVDIEETEVLEK